MYRIYNTAAAFTLIELVITIVLISIMLGAIWMVYDTGLRTFYTQWTRTGIKGEMGRMFINISSELRQVNSVTTAQQRSLTFTLDADSDGVNETLQYTWSGTAGDPLNRISTATTPVVNSVNTLAFSYYDANNNTLSFPVTASQVRAVALDATVVDNDETFRLRSEAKIRTL